MKNFENDKLHRYLKLLLNDSKEVLETDFFANEISAAKFFFTKEGYFTIVINESDFSIKNKLELLKLLHYQLSLVTMHQYNWDAFEEAINDMLVSLTNHKGIIIIFENGQILGQTITEEFKILFDIVKELNQNDLNRKVSIFLNCIPI